MVQLICERKPGHMTSSRQKLYLTGCPASPFDVSSRVAAEDFNLGPSNCTVAVYFS